MKNIIRHVSVAMVLGSVILAGVITSHAENKTLTITKIKTPATKINVKIPPQKPLGNESPIPAPINLQALSSSETCGDFVKPKGGSFYQTLCQEAMNNNFVVLAWKWNEGFPDNKPKDTDISGYHIYHMFMSNGFPGAKVIATQSNPQMRMSAVEFAPFATPTEGACYSVKAFRGNKESDFSNVLCVKPGSLPNTSSTLTPSQVKTFTKQRFDDTGFSLKCLTSGGLGNLKGSNNAVPVNSTDRMLVGYDNFFDTDKQCEHSSWNWNAYRGGVKFDITPKTVSGKVVKATLKTSPLKSEFQTANQSTPSGQCVAGLIKANSDWTGISNQMVSELPGGDAVINFPYTPGVSQNLNDTLFKYQWSKGFSIIVTDTVNAWAKNQTPNHGFLFRGGHETLSGNDTDFCHSWLGPFTLTVEKEYPSIN